MRVCVCVCMCVLMLFSISEIFCLRDHILRVKCADRVPMLICGNKVDLVQNRKVSQEEAEAFCREHHVPYLETSAKTNANVEKVS